MKNRTRTINLLRHQEKPALDKFIDWAFTVGRGIVIITESIALSAFVYRFVLDRQIIDLRDEIKQKQAIVSLSKTNEDSFRNLQNRLSVAKNLDQQSIKKPYLLSQILKQATGVASFTSIAITETSISLSGATSSMSTLQSFSNNIKSIPDVLNINLGSVKNNSSTGLVDFSINITLKQQI